MSELEQGLYPRGQESVFSLQKAGLCWKCQYGQVIKSPSSLISQVCAQLQFHHLSSLVNMVHEPQFPHLVNAVRKHGLRSVGKFHVKCSLLCLAPRDAQCQGADTPHSSLRKSQGLSTGSSLRLHVNPLAPAGDGGNDHRCLPATEAPSHPRSPGPPMCGADLRPPHQQWTSW